MGSGHIGSNLDGTLDLNDRLLQLSRRSVDSSKIEMEFRSRRLQSDRLLDHGDRDIMPAPLTGDNPQEMDGVRIIRRVRKDISIGPLGLIEPAGPVMLQSQLNCLGDRDLRLHLVFNYSFRSR